MTKKTILVTGGCGFIGSHTVVALINNNFSVIIIDDLSNSSIKTIDRIEKITGIRPDFSQIDLKDAIRTICTTAAEDETNLDLVEFNIDYYKAYTEGFLEYMKSSITPLTFYPIMLCMGTPFTNDTYFVPFFLKVSTT